MTSVQPPFDLKAHITKEIAKCIHSPQYFIKTYCKIQHQTKGRIPFALWPKQEEVIQNFEDKQYNIILKGRQIGMSTVVACYALWLMLFHDDKNILVIAHTQEIAKNLVTKVRYSYNALPVWIRQFGELVEDNKLSIKFKNNSQIKAVSAAKDAARSEALALLIIDEAAYVEHAEDIWAAALPTVSTGGKAVIISTPNGVGGWFYKMFTDAELGLLGTRKTSDDGSIEEDKLIFNPIKFDWRVDPDRNEEWRRKMGIAQGERKARQEFDADFMGSGNTVIDAELIEVYAKRCTDPIEKRWPANNLWVWKRADYNKAYIVVADVARGDGEDKSAFHVLDAQTCEQVAEYKGFIDTTQYGHLLINVATEYNNALLVVEREGVGYSVLQTIIDSNHHNGYSNLYYMSKDRQVVGVERDVMRYLEKEQNPMVPGWSTTHKSRPAIINLLDTYMREGQEGSFLIHSKRFIEELRTFVWTNGKAIAMEGQNDDLVLAMSIGLWVRDGALKLAQEGQRLTRSALDNFRVSTGESKNQPPVYTNPFLTYDPYRLPLPNPNGNPAPNQDADSDLRWLFGN